ncbi:hypothetical protein XM38_012180 [Halomicronema hongdechloris C2206]|uniref:Uncharacterized protein n=1 Tax=Halomicronema hongdechloris C2206 TaxID=1641165 RepID=A0A1Z3HJ05_9CYAN|nr:hypothetical protein [Halomicronema hongdechloris]ASC70281.1 hypothetical protein XM38_012180 [Halomicronema hongdechloris C2206]
MNPALAAKFLYGTEPLTGAEYNDLTANPEMARLLSQARELRPQAQPPAQPQPAPQQQYTSEQLQQMDQTELAAIAFKSN